MWIRPAARDRSGTTPQRGVVEGLPSLWFLLGLAVLSGLLGCSAEMEAGPDRSDEPPEPPEPLETRAEDPRPSVVLIVIDTLRADAVSSYGAVAGTTPVLDRLARNGLRYTHAYAPAPWTAPSHASLFSGLRVDEHGVGLDPAHVSPDSLQMLAEDFREAEYVTAGFSENLMVSESFGFEQGFDTFESTSLAEFREAFAAGRPHSVLDLPARLRRWNRLRDKSRPFFLFLNIMDPHDPYLVRDVNPWLPESTPRAEADFIQSRYSIPSSLCDNAPIPKHLEVLHGLYLGNVAAADAKLEEVLRILGDDRDPVSRLMIITSDHGEHFGENRLMGHRFSVGNPVLHIPLIVSGLPETAPATIEHPVGLTQIRQSLLCWALDEGCPADLPVENVSSPEGREVSRPIISIYSDIVAEPAKPVVDERRGPDAGPVSRLSTSRSTCSAQDRVLGAMVSMIRYPMKITWFEQYEPVLHDLSWDPKERFDQTERQPQLATELREELAEFVRLNMTDRDEEELPELSEEGRQMLKSLGYLH